MISALVVPARYHRVTGGRAFLTSHSAPPSLTHRPTTARALPPDRQSAHRFACAVPRPDWSWTTTAAFRYQGPSPLRWRSSSAVFRNQSRRTFLPPCALGLPVFARLSSSRRKMVASTESGPKSRSMFLNICRSFRVEMSSIFIPA